MSNELKGVWAVLREIKTELKDFDDKWEQHIQAAATDRQKLSTLCRQVDNIERLLTRGNGQKPILVQLETIHHDVEQLKKDHTELKKANGIHEPTPEEVKEAQAQAQKAKWMAVAKIAGVLALAIPGLLALMGVGG